MNRARRASPPAAELLDPAPPPTLDLGASGVYPVASAEERVASRDAMRSRRKREVRAKVTSIKRMPKYELELGRVAYPIEEHGFGEGRPRTRGECKDVPRPCPFVSCKHSLYLDVNPATGAIKINKPDLDPDEVDPSESCALDVADRGGASLEEVGALLNVTRELVRQREVIALAKIKRASASHPLMEYVEASRPTRRHLPILVEDDEQPRSGP